MNHVTYRHQQLSSISAIIGGSILLVWGVLSIVLPVRYITTIAPLDTILTTIATYLWVPAVGLLILSLGVAPIVRTRAKRNRLWAAIISFVGMGFICFGGFLTLISLNSIAGALYVSPLPIAGGVLLTAGVYDRVLGHS